MRVPQVDVSCEVHPTEEMPPVCLDAKDILFHSRLGGGDLGGHEFDYIDVQHTSCGHSQAIM